MADAEELVRGVTAADPRAIARALTVVEAGGLPARGLVRRLFPHSGRALTVGVTGPPGAGKSTLIDAMTTALRAGQRRVGVIAVDPSSPYTGGAILGDRIRMQNHAGDDGVFIRSMATRGHLGGLAEAVDPAITVLDAAGMDVVLVETVGVGQGEVEVAAAADVTAVVLVPGLGDEVQSLKAGVLEIADVFVINKADREGADRLAAELESLIGLAPSERRPAILQTVASRGTGVAELVTAIGIARDEMARSGALDAKRRRRFEARLEAAVLAGLRARLGTPSADHRRALVDRLVARELDPESAAAELTAQHGAGLPIDHIGIAVPDLAAAVREYEALGFTVERIEDVPTEKVKVAFLPVGDAHLELLEPTDPTSVIARFLEKRSGLHHVCLRVTDLAETLAGLKSRGTRLLDDVPRIGAGGCPVAFLHPKAAGGVLLELKQVP